VRSVRKARVEWRSPAYQPAAFDSTWDLINGVSIHGFRSFVLWPAEPMLKVDFSNSCEDPTVSVFCESGLRAIKVERSAGCLIM
jgi:hypothetical protein